MLIVLLVLVLGVRVTEAPCRDAGLALKVRAAVLLQWRWRGCG